ncbi:MAG: ABC transporter permease [Tannerella sp.]|jgi:putative ABC transport system permease protein|nr:ABC transporter permease [Tannerella sp.]
MKKKFSYSAIRLFGHSFRQAWNLLRQEKLFSTIYILGTGLSITMVMTLSIVFYIRIADIYPETNRDRMLIVKRVMEKYGNGSSSGSLSLPFVEACFMSLESAEATAVVYNRWNVNHRIQPEGSREQWPVAVQYVDTGYWRVFAFRFVDGSPFTATDFLSGIHTAVIAESLARRLFGTAGATGRYVSVNFSPYRICGVVRDVSLVTERTYAQLWMPCTVAPDYRSSHSENGAVGRMEAYILAPSARDVEKVRTEALERFRRYAGQFDEIELSIFGQPDRHWQSLFRSLSNAEIDFTRIAIQYGLILLILLLVPAISLSGMADSRMERRLAEMGVRRAFGAPRGVLMRQIVVENFLFTLLGGIVGLLMSYVLILFSSDWIMTLGQKYIDIPPEGTVAVFTPPMLLNLPVFGIALAVCLLLNLMSSLLPAWKASRREIVYSINS